MRCLRLAWCTVLSAVSLLPAVKPFATPPVPTSLRSLRPSESPRSIRISMLNEGGKPPRPVPASCDYLVVGGGATGMAFVDTLLHHHQGNPSVVMVDAHESPGGQWHDSYEFVRLHQPSAMYGVESERLEGGENAASHRATRDEILDYYSSVQKKLEEKFNFQFCGGMKFDFDASSAETGLCVLKGDSAERTEVNAKKIVDARFLEPDLPVFVGAKFRFDPAKIRVVPVNALADSAHGAMIGDEGLPTGSNAPAATNQDAADGTGSKKYVVIGAGKTGMDACVFLQTAKGVAPSDIMWVMPHDAWITARENIASCMEFLHKCVQEATKHGQGETRPSEIVGAADFLQRGFLKLEEEGKVYRFSPEILPTKFKDATLCERELGLLRRLPHVVRGARVEAISDDGSLHLVGGQVVALPWASAEGQDSTRLLSDTTFVHCSAGAFNYHKLLGQEFPALFTERKITIQDVYGTPGFCFVGSLVGKLEAMGDTLTDAEKNAMCKSPLPSPADTSDLGPSGGDVGTLWPEHGLVQRLCNLRQWYAAGLGDWLHGSEAGKDGHRLFNLAHLERGHAESLVHESFAFVSQAGLVKE